MAHFLLFSEKKPEDLNCTDGSGDWSLVTQTGTELDVDGAESSQLAEKVRIRAPDPCFLTSHSIDSASRDETWKTPETVAQDRAKVTKHSQKLRKG
jgi:hypothetical protein